MGDADEPITAGQTCDNTPIDDNNTMYTVYYTIIYDQSWALVE